MVQTCTIKHYKSKIRLNCEVHEWEGGCLTIQSDDLVALSPTPHMTFGVCLQSLMEIEDSGSENNFNNLEIPSLPISTRQ